MADIFSKSKRSEIMSKIKGKNTKIEVSFRKQLWARGCRYRIGHKLFGKPDVVFPSKKVAIFVDGCFWHMCPKCNSIPSTNKKFWIDKLKKNVERDKKVSKILKKKGWTVLRLWEHDIKKNMKNCIKKTEKILESKKQN